MFCHSPDHDHRDVGAARPGRPPARTRRPRRSPSGSCGALPPNMSNIDGNIALHDRHAAGVLDPHAVADLAPDAVEHGDRLVEVEVEDPGPEGVALGVGQRPDDRDRAQARRRRAAAGRPRCAAAPRTARRPPGPRPGGPGRPAPPGRDPRRRTGASNRPIRILASRTRRTLASSASLARRARTRAPRAGARRPGRRSPSPGRRPASTARAPASVRSAAKPWVTRFRTALASLTTKPSKPQVSRSTSVNSHRLPVAGMPLRSMYAVMMLPAPGLDRRPERREVRRSTARSRTG